MMRYDLDYSDTSGQPWPDWEPESATRTPTAPPSRLARALVELEQELARRGLR